MSTASAVNPVFSRGSVAEHTMFVVAMCRFQHHSLALSLVHYLTWSAMHVGLYAIAFKVFGIVGAAALAAAVTLWALRMDAGIGILFGLMEAAFVLAAQSLVVSLDASTTMTVAWAFGAMVASLAVEVASHLAVQGYPPSPPPRATEGLSVLEKIAFVPYFVVLFGLFFLTLDLAMRFTAYRAGTHGRANAVAGEWHRDAIHRAGDESRSRELDLHRRAASELARTA
jgi:hypothetical protein